MVDLAGVADLYAAAVRDHREGNLAAAERAYLEVVARDPQHGDAIHMLGVIALSEGRLEEACDRLRHAVAVAPEHAQYQNNLGVALRATGQSEDAIQAFRKAIAFEPRSADAFGNLGNALLDRGDARDAVSAYSQALALVPNSVACRAGLASAYRLAGDLTRSIAIYEALVSERPRDPGLLNNLGVVRMEFGDLAGAESCYGKALEIAPKFLETLNNISVLYLTQGDANGAETVLRKALKVVPDSATVLGNLGNVQRRQGRTAAAASSYRKALSITPNDGLQVRLATLLPVIAESGDEMARARVEMENDIDALLEKPLQIDDPISEIGATNFHLSYHDENNRRLNTKIAQLYRQASPVLNFVAPHCRESWHPEGRRLKVGFISRNLRDHAVGWCYHRLICRLPKDRFEILAFSFHQGEDPVWSAISEEAEKAVILPTSLPTAQEQVAREALDVLIYTDIGLDPITYFLAFARLAPVQCVTNGHPDTTGIPTIDYFLSSGPLEDSQSPGQYSERLVAFGDVLVDYARPNRPAPFRGRAAFDLPKDATLYLCPQSLFKIHPEMDDALADILERDEKAHLLVFAGPEPGWWHSLRRRWESRFLENMKRIQVLERQSFPNFLNILAHADVVLDTWPFCGGNTAYQAFAMGRPVVTMPGRFARGRSTAALYERMEIDALLAGSPDEYVDLAVRLGTDEEWRREVASTIEVRADRLFEDGNAVLAFTDFLASLSGPSEAVA